MQGDFRLDDVGEVVPVAVYCSGYHSNSWDIIKKKVIMVIKAPRGSCAIFEQSPEYNDSVARGIQSQAVRAFMEQHCPPRKEHTDCPGKPCDGCASEGTC